jgi:hypothetical protein
MLVWEVPQPGPNKQSQRQEAFHVLLLCRFVFKVVLCVSAPDMDDGDALSKSAVCLMALYLEQ